jgi:hypothetical protein
MKLIAFSGKRGTGKTTGAKYLVNGYGYELVSFASAIKDIAENLFPGVGNAPKEKPFKPFEWSPRDFSIALGELGRYFDPNIWVSRVLNSLKKNGKYVVDDLRFPNEAVMIKNLGGKIVRLNRYESQNSYGKNLDIQSETALDDYKGFDFIVPEVGNTSIKTLTDQIDLFMEDHA